MRVMRVLTRPNVGGPTRQMVALWHAFADRGVRTLLVVGQCEDEAAVDLSADGVPEVACDAVDRDSAGFVVVPELRRALRPLLDRRARRRLAQLIAAFAPDVVHTHTSKAGALARPVARRLDVPVVAHTFHGHVLHDYYARWRAALLGRIERGLAKRTDLLFAVSPSCRDELAALRVAPADRIVVVPPAVDVRAFAASSRAAARAELGLDARAFVLGFVGRLVPIKRPELFADVVRADGGAIGLVFGDGPLRARLDGEPRLRLLGATARLPVLLPACDALVITSVREGCPLAAIEAFAAGVPVVGVDVPGVRDVLVGWGAGLLVGSADASKLGAACARVRQGQERDTIVRIARAAIDTFAPERVAATLAIAYEGALRAKRPLGEPA